MLDNCSTPGCPNVVFVCVCGVKQVLSVSPGWRGTHWVDKADLEFKRSARLCL